MPPYTPELRALGAGQVDGLGEMLLELAAQLHVERVRVRVLEHHLRALVPIPDGPLAVPADAAELRQQLDRDLRGSIAGLLAAATERDDARSPLRDELGTDAKPDGREPARPSGKD